MHYESGGHVRYFRRGKGDEKRFSSSSQFSNLRWRYFVESLLLKSTPNVSSVVLSSARVAASTAPTRGPRASRASRRRRRLLRRDGRLARRGLLGRRRLLGRGFFGDFLTAGFLAGAGDAARGCARRVRRRLLGRARLAAQGPRRRRALRLDARRLRRRRGLLGGLGLASARTSGPCRRR